MPIRTQNPATEEPLETFAELAPADLEQAIARSARAFADWSRSKLADRSAVLRRVAGLLRGEKAELARHAAREMGKPVVQGEAELEKCAWACDFYAAEAERMLAPEPVGSDAAKSYVRFDPLGPLLAVMPWNFPYWQVFRAAAPALMAGNTVLLKHASNVPRCALEIQDVFARAGLPAGAFQTLLVGSGAVEAIIAHPAVRAVTLTGSEPAGRAVAAAAGRALKKTVLELGGSDPFVVLDDVDVEAVARAAAAARTQNSGQSCIAAKRFVVQQRIADRFAEAFRAALEALVVGDPLDRATQVGPLARGDLLQELSDQVARALKGGARLLCGGARLPRRGFFYAPTLLGELDPASPVLVEETFGPVAALVRVAGDDEAVSVANASRFGLGATIWSGDAARAEALAPRIEAGCVTINGILRSDPRLPFGGIKDSGYGRELAAYGIREFVNIKAVAVAK
jgi:succinate-semialdehyde dehydrogenase/glutarate-semialdehyde dehydrogenase